MKTRKENFDNNNVVRKLKPMRKDHLHDNGQ